MGLRRESKQAQLQCRTCWTSASVRSVITDISDFSSTCLRELTAAAMVVGLPTCNVSKHAFGSRHVALVMYLSSLKL